MALFQKNWSGQWDLAGGNKMTSKCHFMTTGEELLDCKKRQRNENNLYNSSDRNEFALRLTQCLRVRNVSLCRPCAHSLTLTGVLAPASRLW